MKKVIMILMAVAVITAAGVGSAFAAAAGSTSLQSGTVGINVGFGDSVFGDVGVVTISGKFFMQDNLALIGGLGVQASSGDLDANFFGISGGARYYFRTDEFAPFVEGKLSYADEEVDVNATGNRIDHTAIDFAFLFGGEYFLQKHFSIEGSAGFGFGTETIRTPGLPDQDVTYFGTRTVGVSANFYF